MKHLSFVILIVVNDEFVDIDDVQNAIDD